MAQKLMMDGHRVWLKVYEERSRSRLAATLAWNLITEGLGTKPLLSPPPHGVEKTRRIEMGRIDQLRGQGVWVPQILAEGKGAILLSDTGSSLSSQLKAAANDEQVDCLVDASVAAIVSAHRRGAYLGQAYARNITVSSDGRIGFIDFEEDPLEVMSLPDAQARDWLMFAAGVARHFESRSDVLVGMLRQGRLVLEDEVVIQLQRSAKRLGFLQRCTCYMGMRARALGVAVMSVGKGFSALALGLLVADFLLDGDSDIFNFLQDFL